jgi:lipid-A-disaccharide synthase-like uncharacterized protein
VLIWLKALGWLGTACFFSRFLIQWWLSERARQSVAPAVFWWLSLAGSVLVGIYACGRDETLLLVGYVLNSAIYARNLWLQRDGQRRRMGPVLAGGIAVVAAAALLFAGFLQKRNDPTATIGWLAVAGVGQAIWSSRFVVQWWLSEKRGHSHFPAAFWWLSLLGNALLLSYAIHLADAILIAGFSTGPIVQLRNLALGGRPASAAGAR